MPRFADKQAEQVYREAMELAGRFVGLDLRRAPLSFALAFAKRFNEAHELHADIIDRNARYWRVTRDLTTWLLQQHVTMEQRH